MEIQLTDNLTVKHRLHVVQDNFPIAEDGIIGTDFFEEYKVDIIYSISKLKIDGHLINFTNDTGNKIILPPRSETIIKIQTPTDHQFISNALEIKPGIYIPHILLKPMNHGARIVIDNTMTVETELNQFHPTLELFTDQVHNQIQYNRNSDRRDQILKIISENLDMTNNVEENASILTLCMKYEDVFFIEGDRLTSIKGIKHDINLYTDTKPIHVQRYRLPQTHKNEINRQVKEMLEEGKIQTSISPYNSPLLAVPKKPDKDGSPKWRVVVDFRKLNEVTIGDSFPLPNINDILDQLGHAQYFSTLDMASGYHQIEMNPRDCHKTAFSTDYGHFEFTRMPFGLKNSQATFQRAINHILRGFQGLKGFVYLDDVIVYGKNLKDHNTN